MSPLKTELKTQIAEGNLNSVVKTLLDKTQGQLHNDVVQLSSRLTKFNRQQNQGTLSYSEINLYHNQLTTTLLNLVDELPEDANAKVKPSPPPKSASFSPLEPSIFEKYGKYLLLIMIPFLVWGINLMTDKKTESHFGGMQNVESNFKENEPINEGAPLRIDFEWGKDLIKVTYSGGKPPYSLTLMKGITQKFGTNLKDEGSFQIKVFDSYRKDDGKHQLVLKDVNGEHVQKDIIIDPLKVIESEQKPTPSENKPAYSNNSDTFTDSRDGQTYKSKRLKDGKKWMSENLNYKTADSWWYDNNSSNGDKYGRLYTWEAAKKACPSGWRLPTDDEWWKMASFYGKANNSLNGQQKNDSSDGGETAYKALMQSGSSGFSALLGGGHYSSGFGNIGSRGSYWSRTEQDSSTAWYYYFGNLNKNLYRFGSNKHVVRSCRCLQD